MKVTESEIIDFLTNHSTWQPATILATQFGVTTRTIRNRVAKINGSANLIESGPLGYRLKNKPVTPTQGLSDKDISIKIFNLLFKSPNNSLKLVDVLEQTYFSEMTIRNATAGFNTRYKNMGLRIHFKTGWLILEGDEYQQRSLFHKFVGKSVRNFSSSWSLTGLTSDISVSNLQNIIISVVNANDLVINGYEMHDLLLHYAISINRILHGNKYQSFDVNRNVKVRPEYRLTKAITSKISALYNLRFNEFEVQALTLALIGKTITQDVNDQKVENIKEYVPKEIIDACTETITDIEREYDLQLNNSEFSIRFIIHVKNMVDRYLYFKEQPTKNFDYLTRQYPLLYEMALFALDDVGNKLQMDFRPSESIYLMLHLGAYLEFRKGDRINTVLVIPTYYDTEFDIEKKLLDQFWSDIDITKVITKEQSSFEDINSKLILTTEDVPLNNSNYVVKISPMLTSVDIAKVRKTVESIKKSKEISDNLTYLEKYSSAKLFKLDERLRNKENVLKYMADILHQNGYTKHNFIEEINEREKMAATNFGIVAIPHALKMNASKTGILVLVNRPGIEWIKGKQRCQIVIMFAVNQRDIQSFGNLLQSLISVLSIKKNSEKLSQTDSYHDFIEQLKVMMSKKQ